MKKAARKKKKSLKGHEQSRNPTRLGYDFGWPRNIAVIPATEFNDNLQAAGILGCAYAPECNPDEGMPWVTLLVTNPEPLKKAFEQFQAWIDCTGPDALSVEVLYVEQGYYLGIDPNFRHLMWRTIGLDKTTDPQVFGLTYIKYV